MLSSSHPKIHNPRVTGVSPRPKDRLQRQKLRNTSDPVSADNQVTCATCMYPAGRPCRSRPASNTYQAAEAVSCSLVTARNWAAGASLGMRIHSTG
jgi:hypothetical protein